MKLTYGFKLADIVIVIEKNFHHYGHSGYRVTIKGTGDLIFKTIGSKPFVYRTSIAPRLAFKLFVYAVEAGFFEMKKEYHHMEITVFGDGEIYEIQPIYDYKPGPSQNTVIKISTGKNTKRVCNHENYNKRFLALEKHMLKESGIEKMFPLDLYNEDGTIRKIIIPDENGR